MLQKTGNVHEVFIFYSNIYKIYLFFFWLWMCELYMWDREIEMLQHITIQSDRKKDNVYFLERFKT